MARSNVELRALGELAEGYIELHDQQASSTGSYKDALDLLQNIYAPLIYLLKHSSTGNKSLDNIIKRVMALDYTVLPVGEEPNDPF